MRHSRPFFSFVFVVVVVLLLLLLLVVVSSSSHGDLARSLRLELSAAPIAAASRIDRLRAIARSDQLRQGLGAYTGTGQYFVRFRVGTPAQRFVLVADTGSDLTWVKCRLRRRRRHHLSTAATARAAALGFSGRRSRRPGTRSGARRRCARRRCPSPSPRAPPRPPPAPTTTGTRTGRRQRACSRASRRRSRWRAASGRSCGADRGLHDVVGGVELPRVGRRPRLGYSNVSFAARAAARFGGRFSYCLVDHLSPRNASSFLTFGPNPALSDDSPSPPRRRARPRSSSSRACSPSTACRCRPCPSTASPSESPTACGTSRGRRHHPRLRHQPHRAGRPGVQGRGGGAQPAAAEFAEGQRRSFEYCYNWTAVAGSAAEGSSALLLPKLVVHFAGGRGWSRPRRAT
uniref:Peptidase A1 domain-containing protein n=1 Tax=Ananas comosus var. bracteatus TaxID=296719 RepID=A0A6V7PUE5_ANACO|nr:unnamed protein product [Ananas comosus var. bracteatus]